MSSVERVVNALREPTRRAILLGFYEEGEPRTVDEVAARVGVHRTVAFNHLERLTRLGYLLVERRRGQPGKPAKLYRAAPGGLELSYPQRRFSELAALLAGALDNLGPGGVEAARRVGLRFGGSRPGLVDELGGGYRTEGAVITSTNCVFREACDRARAVVCGLHAGLLEGARRQEGLTGRIHPEGPVADSGCRFVVKESIP